MGRATALLAAQRGNAVTLIGQRAAKLDEVVERAVAATVTCFGALHDTVDNTGVAGLQSPTGELPADEWRRVLSIKVDGAAVEYTRNAEYQNRRIYIDADTSEQLNIRPGDTKGGPFIATGQTPAWIRTPAGRHPIR